MSNINRFTEAEIRAKIKANANPPAPSSGIPRPATLDALDADPAKRAYDLRSYAGELLRVPSGAFSAQERESLREAILLGLDDLNNGR
jgi:hypothetical protein